MNTNDIVFKLYSKNDFTDIEYLKIRELNIDVKSFSELLMKQKFSSEFSKKIVLFFLVFENGCFSPEKVDVYEPISEKYSDEMFITIIDWMSQAGGGLMFKKNKKIKYSAIFENQRISKIWTDGKCNLNFNDPIYLSQLTIIFPNYITKDLTKIREFCSKLNNLAQPSIAYLYKGENVDYTQLDKFNKDDLIEELKKYNSELITIF